MKLIELFESPETRNIFIYGSLWDRSRKNLTLHRKIANGDYLIATLKDYRREWSAVDTTKNKSYNPVYLNLRKHSGRRVNGLVLTITEAQFQRLRKREGIYKYIDVTSNIKIDDPEKKKPKGRIYTFINRLEYYIEQVDNGKKNFIERRYETMVKEAAKKISGKFYQDYIKYTSPSKLKRR